MKRRAGSTFLELLGKFKAAANPVTKCVYRQILIDRLYRNDIERQS